MVYALNSALRGEGTSIKSSTDRKFKASLDMRSNLKNKKMASNWTAKLYVNSVADQNAMGSAVLHGQTCEKGSGAME